MPSFMVFSALKAAGVKQLDIARACGVSSTTVSTVLNGKTKSERVAREIARATGVPFEDLFPEYNAKPERKA